MARTLLLIIGLLAVDVHALKVFPRRGPARPVSTKTAVIDDSVFTLINGSLYRVDSDTRTPKSVARRPRLEKIARFKDMLAGLTYHGELRFWKKGADQSWRPVAPIPDAHGVVDFSANQNVLVTVNARGLVHQWTSLRERFFVPGPANVTAIEGYAAELGFGLISNQRKIYLVPDSPCGRLLVDVSRL